MKKLYIFKVGETFENTKKLLGDFDAWVAQCISSNLLVETIDILAQEELPPFESVLGIIITGSHSMVTDEEAWSLKTEKWISQAQEHSINILGICYGHQLIAKALGGRSDYNPKGKEIGSVTIFTNNAKENDPLFKDAPNTFFANVTHMQSVLSLPEGAQILGYNEHDKHQIVRYTPNIWGVQFHPEYTITIIQEYIKEQADELIALGFSPQKLLKDVMQTHYANSLIESFAKMLSK